VDKLPFQSDHGKAADQDGRPGKAKRKKESLSWSGLDDYKINEKQFHFTFWPAPSVAAETEADVKDLYRTVTQCFHFQG
jgi:hypothetical protein